MKKIVLSASIAALLAATGSSAFQGKKGAAGDAAKGKELFEQCSVCHNADSDEKKMGPGLKGLFKKGKLASGKPANEANVRAIIDAGGNGMPAYESILSAEEKNHVIAYLKTL